MADTRNIIWRLEQDVAICAAAVRDLEITLSSTTSGLAEWKKSLEIAEQKLKEALNG